MNFERLKKIQEQKEYRVLDVEPGQYLEIHEKIGQGNNQRTWKFKGLVLKVRRPGSPEGSFTVRGKVAGVTVEKVYPLSFVKFESVNVIEEHKVRRAKIYYIREKIGKKARLKRKQNPQKIGKDLVNS